MPLGDIRTALSLCAYAHIMGQPCAASLPTGLALASGYLVPSFVEDSSVGVLCRTGAAAEGSSACRGQVCTLARVSKAWQSCRSLLQGARVHHGHVSKGPFGAVRPGLHPCRIVPMSRRSDVRMSRSHCSGVPRFRVLPSVPLCVAVSWCPCAAVQVSIASPCRHVRGSVCHCPGVPYMSRCF